MENDPSTVKLGSVNNHVESCKMLYISTEKDD